jgi:hypothetical protein
MFSLHRSWIRVLTYILINFLISTQPVKNFMTREHTSQTHCPLLIDKNQVGGAMRAIRQYGNARERWVTLGVERATPSPCGLAGPTVEQAARRGDEGSGSGADLRGGLLTVGVVGGGKGDGGSAVNGARGGEEATDNSDLDTTVGGGSQTARLRSRVVRSRDRATGSACIWLTINERWDGVISGMSLLCLI